MKTVILLVRREDWTHEEFAEYWETEHAPLVDDVPGVRKYATSLPTDPERSEYDGIAEIYFDDTAAMGEAFESEAGQALQADAAEFADMEASPTLYVEETVRLDETG